MKILFIGNPAHQLIQNLVRELKKNDSSLRVDIISVPFHHTNNNHPFDNVFNIESKLKVIERIPLLKIIYYYRAISKLVNKLDHYDTISIQMVYYYYCLLVNNIKSKCSKFVLSFWGSDFNNLNVIYKQFLKIFVRHADGISCANIDLKKRIVSYFKVDEIKISIVRFGLSPLHVLCELKKTTDNSSAKKSLGLANNTLITIGYNASKFQNHIDVIESINKVKHHLPENYLLLFPLTYGYGNIQKYIANIESRLKELDLNFKIYDTYLDDRSISLVRLATDVFIQVQDMDQFSGSMQEHLFAGNIVITGSWLPYKTFKDEGLYFLEVDNIEDIESKLPFALAEIEVPNEKRTSNPNKIWNLSSWEKSIKMWVDFLK